MRFGFAVPSYGPNANGQFLAELLRAGDELGYDAAWWPDHLAVPEYATRVNLSPPFLEPLAACAWGMALTRRLRFGTDVLVAPYRHPLQVAAMAGTLGRLAGDRLVLGVGIGYLKGEFEALGVDYRARAALTEDFLRTLRRPPEGWFVAEGPAPVPVWVGGNNPRALRRAALLGDGWHPLWVPADRYRAARTEILALRAAHGLTGHFTFSFSAGRTEILDRLPGSWPEPAPPAPAGSEFAYAPAPWVAEDGRPRLVGTPDEVVADLRLLADAGVEQVTLRFGAAIDQLERFARDVAPAFG